VSFPPYRVVVKPLAGVVRSGACAWQATNADPHVLLALPWGRPRYVVFTIEALDDQVDPVLYFDVGGGFGESSTYALSEALKVTGVICLAEIRGIRAIRLDPMSRPGSFTLRAAAYDQGRPALWRAERWRRAHAAAMANPVEIIGGEQWGASHKTRSRRRGAPQIDDHFRHVVSLAAALPLPVPRRGVAPDQPFVSFVAPVYNTRPAYLDDLLASVRAQRDVPAELVLSDDGSADSETRAWLAANACVPGLTVVVGDRNRGIAEATNAGLAVARGEWVALIDHDDALSPFALKVVAAALQRSPEAQFAYTDEVITDAQLRPTAYFLKPAFDPILLSGVNYINHLSFYRRERLARIGGLDPGFQGSQDYDLLLRYLDGLEPREIIHVPYPAYQWRRDGKSYSARFLETATASARRALARHYGRVSPDVTIEPALLPDLHRVRFDGGAFEWPPVSVIIPNRDAFELLSAVLSGLAEKTDYPALEVIIVDNGTTDPRVLELYESYRPRFPAFKVNRTVEAFNFSRAINRGVDLASGRYLLLLNNDIEIVDPTWLKEMVACFGYPNIGIVGARLLYPDRTIQHAGVIVGLGGLAGHWFSKEPLTEVGPMGRLAVRQCLSAVTGAAMLVSRDCFAATGPFNEEAFAISYNDVDFCLRARQLGFRTVWTPFATLIHHESATRGSDERPEAIERFRREQGCLRTLHHTDSIDDPAFNPWYSRNRSNPIYRFLNELPRAR
jgi:GT2 family glycosyltransferase